MVEALGLAAAKGVVGAAGKFALSEASKRSGFDRKINTAKSFLTDDADIAVNDITANRFLRTAVKYMFYDNYIKNKSPNVAQLDFMLYLIFITIDKGYFRFALTSKNIQYDESKFINRDFSTFHSVDEKREIIESLIGVDMDLNKLLKINPIQQGSRGSHDSHELGMEGGDKKRKYKTKKNRPRKYKTKKNKTKKGSKKKRTRR